MILLRKKRIIILTIAVFFSINIAVFNSLNGSSSNNLTAPTVALPVSNKVIVVDAGHGVPDEGC